MPLFRRPSRPLDLAALTALSDRELGRHYRSIDGTIDADGDPQRRARALDAIAEEVLRRDPTSSAFWYDRGMYAKWRSDWPASLECNRRALDLIPATERAGEPAAWNLGIAATALRDWAEARRAWTAFGIELPDVGDVGALEADFSIAPVRLNPEPRFVGQEPVVVDGVAGDTEVVWGRRLCPARIRIENIPTPESGHRFGDVVLHDGDPVGTRRLGDQDMAVFNEILLWEHSPLPTLTATLHADTPAAVDELVDLLDAAEGAAEDWTSSIQLLCRACSEGSPDPGDHDHGPSAGWSTQRSVGLAGDPDTVAQLLRRWVGTDPRRSFTDLKIALR